MVASTLPADSASVHLKRAWEHVPKQPLWNVPMQGAVACTLTKWTGLWGQACSDLAPQAWKHPHFYFIYRVLLDEHLIFDKVHFVFSFTFTSCIYAQHEVSDWLKDTLICISDPIFNTSPQISRSYDISSSFPSDRTVPGRWSPVAADAIFTWHLINSPAPLTSCPEPLALLSSFISSHFPRALDESSVLMQ